MTPKFEASLEEMGNIVEVCTAVQGTPLRSESDTETLDTSHLCRSFISFIVLVIIIPPPLHTAWSQEIPASVYTAVTWSRAVAW